MSFISKIHGRYRVISAVMFKEFPTIEFPKELIALGFEDQSWHNDAMAAAWKTLPSGKALIAWINFDDENERECGDKYALILNSNSDHSDENGGTEILDTDSFQAFLDAIHANLNK